MIREPVQVALDRVWAGYLEGLEVDLLAHRVTLHIWAIEHSNRIDHRMVFEGVASFMYIDDEGEARLDPMLPSPEAVLEVLAIWYYEDGVGRIAIASNAVDWAKRWCASANFVLELSVHMLLIEASRVTVDGEGFDVGYPPTSWGTARAGH
jgi:hypothetical protein